MLWSLVLAAWGTCCRRACRLTSHPLCACVCADRCHKSGTDQLSWHLIADMVAEAGGRERSVPAVEAFCRRHLRRQRTSTRGLPLLRGLPVRLLTCEKLFGSQGRC